MTENKRRMAGVNLPAISWMFAAVLMASVLRSGVAHGAGDRAFPGAEGFGASVMAAAGKATVISGKLK